MPVDVNVASALLEQIQDYHQRPSAKLVESSSYSAVVHVGRREVRKWIQSYVYNVDGEDLRVDVMDGKIYRPGCGGSTRAMIFIARRVSL